MNKLDINYAEWAEPKPFGVSGCFRLRNEAEFMEAAILSHLPFLNEAVLVVQPSDDDTVERAHTLAQANTKVRVYEYPHIVDWIDTPGFYENDPDQPGHWVHLSNWALTKCRYAWIAKTEGDVICLSSFERIIDRINAHPHEQHYYGRVILNVAGYDCDQISMRYPRNAGWDEAVFPNSPDYKFIRSGKFETIIPGEARTCMGWSGLHMKRCKAGNLRIGEYEPWAAYTPENVQAALVEFNQANNYQGIDAPLGEDCLYEREWINHYLGSRNGYVG